MLRVTTALFSLALVFSFGALLHAQGVSVGDKAPAFSGLDGVDGKQYSLADLKDAKAIVVVFSCNGCPEIVKREDAFTSFAKDYAAKGVKMIAINSNANDSNTLEAMKDRAEKKGFTFIYAADKDQSVGRQFGARVTPHCYVIDGNGVVQYTGAYDKGDAHYVKDAVDAILAGKKPAVQETKAFGCGIPFRKGA